MLYQYLCECGTNFDEFRSYENRHSAICPMCKSCRVTKLISTPLAVMGVTSMKKDLNGTPIWFPKDGEPYYDKVLRKKFDSPQDKKQYMDSKRIVMDGSYEPDKTSKKKLAAEVSDFVKKEKQKEKVIKRETQNV